MARVGFTNVVCTDYVPGVLMIIQATIVNNPSGPLTVGQEIIGRFSSTVDSQPIIVPSAGFTITFTFPDTVPRSPLECIIVDTLTGLYVEDLVAPSIPPSFFNLAITNYTPYSSIRVTASVIQGRLFSPGNRVSCEISRSGGASGIVYTSSIPIPFPRSGNISFDFAITEDSPSWELTIRNLDYFSLFNTFLDAVPVAPQSFTDPFIRNYIPNTGLVFAVQGNALGGFLDGQEINCKAQSSTGGPIYNSRNNIFFNSSTTIARVFPFLINTSSVYWDFFITNISNSQTINFRNIHIPPINGVQIINYIPLTSMDVSFTTDGEDLWTNGDGLSIDVRSVSGISPSITSTYDILIPTNVVTIPIPGLSDSEWIISFENTASPVRSRALVEFYSMPIPICFLEGTLIRTAAGDVPVESLKAGDSVLSAGTLKDRSLFQLYESLSEKTIKKMVDFKLTTFCDISRPINIKAGALSENLPEQDLFVSPWHGIIVDGVLKNADTLLNGDTIAYDYSIKSAHYYHVELKEHSVILANGANTESYYDDANNSRIISNPLANS